MKNRPRVPYDHRRNTPPMQVTVHPITKNRIDVRDRSACELGCSRMQGIREQERYLVNRIGPDEVLENDDGVSVMIAS